MFCFCSTFYITAQRLWCTCDALLGRSVCFPFKTFPWEQPTPYVTFYVLDHVIMEEWMDSVCLSIYFHPSIFYTGLIRRSGRVMSAGAYPGGHRARGGPPVHHRATQRQTTSYSLLCFRTILETPIMLDGGRKPEYPERTHEYTGGSLRVLRYFTCMQTCKLHTERKACSPLSSSLHLSICLSICLSLYIDIYLYASIYIYIYISI